MYDSDTDALLSLLPFAIIAFIVFLFAIPLSRRKGRGFGYALLCLVPLVGTLVLFYLLSLTDKQVLDRLAALEGKATR